MEYMKLEVEIRARVDGFEKIKETLKKIGADFSGTETQIDRIFGASKFLDSNRMIVEGGLSARIRETNNKKTLEFKEILRERGGIELSSELTNTGMAEKMLKKLDFEEAFTIKKTRENYSHKDFTISLDKVEKLGNFIEIEKIVHSEDGADEARKECLALLNVLAPEAKIETRKYGDLMQEIINQRE